MRRVAREAYQATHRPLPGSPRDLRLRVLAASLREMAARSGLSHETVRRIEREFEDPDARPTVSNRTLYRYAATIERMTRRRTKVADLRSPHRGHA